MTRPTALFSVALLALPLAAAAQTAPTTPRHATVLDLGGAVGPTLNYGSVAAWRLWGLDAAGRLQVGLGVRGTHFFADEATYDGQNVRENSANQSQYTLYVPSPRITALNIALQLRARVAGPVRVGFSIDLAGLSTGPERVGRADGTLFNIAPNRAGTRPVRQNLLLGGNRDRGSLNSELYAAVDLPRNFSLRGGYSHLVTAFEQYAFLDDAGRYRRFSNLAVLGLNYEF